MVPRYKECTEQKRIILTWLYCCVNCFFRSTKRPLLFSYDTLARSVFPLDGFRSSTDIGARSESVGALIFSRSISARPAMVVAVVWRGGGGGGEVACGYGRSLGTRAFFSISFSI